MIDLNGPGCQSESANFKMYIGNNQSRFFHKDCFAYIVLI